MPPRRPPADPTKQNPTGVRPARNGKRWVLAGTVGDFTADAVPTKRDTTVLTKQEKDAGLTKLDRDTEFSYRDGQVKPDAKTLAAFEAESAERKEKLP